MSIDEQIEENLAHAAVLEDLIEEAFEAGDMDLMREYTVKRCELMRELMQL